MAVFALVYVDFSSSMQNRLPQLTIEVCKTGRLALYAQFVHFLALDPPDDDEGRYRVRIG